MINLFGENVVAIRKLELGSGKFPREGFTGIDIIDFGNNIVWDLEKGLPSDIESNSVEEIVADNVLEHVKDLIQLMNDCNRVLVKGGTFEIIVPLFPTIGAIKDPTHVRFFVEESFDYFDKAWDYEKQPEYGIRKFNVVSKERIDPSDYKVTEDTTFSGNGKYVYLKVILRK